MGSENLTGGCATRGQVVVVRKEIEHVSTSTHNTADGTVTIPVEEYKALRFCARYLADGHRLIEERWVFGDIEEWIKKLADNPEFVGAAEAWLRVLKRNSKLRIAQSDHTCALLSFGGINYLIPKKGEPE